MTTSQIRYPNPPITEAVIDIRSEVSDDGALDQLQAFASTLEADYASEEIKMQSVDIQFNPREGATTQQPASQEITGYILRHKKEPYVLQIRPDAFIFSRLVPYECWQSLRQEAQRLWEHYQEALNGLVLARLATRYINRIDIPAGEVELTKYFRTSPELSSDMPQAILAGFLMQLHLPQPDIEAHAILNQALIAPAQEGMTSIILDIDLFRTDNLPDDVSKIWELLDVLRERKNALFESCITNQTRSLFQ